MAMQSKSLKAYLQTDLIENRFVDVLGEKQAPSFMAALHGRYTNLHAGRVYEGEIRRFNLLTDEAELGDRTSDKVVGYVAYMRLVNGFAKPVYITTSEIEAHALKYSQSYSYDKRFGKTSLPWSMNFDEMTSKIVFKKLLNSWGILFADMAEAILSRPRRCHQRQNYLRR